ncbi:DUF2273 domain-containing protein [Salinithrix halophila]|uniref:DUF2273 domain-containing protein n=1 Tax=Salinithrix halophila TaxID=1485204 RepID=A0ABV8JM00_9BACL
MDRLWETHRGRMFGIGAGIFLGFIYLIFGLWKTLVFGVFILAGYLIGQWIDSRDDLRELLDSVIPEKWLRK